MTSLYIREGGGLTRPRKGDPRGSEEQARQRLYERAQAGDAFAKRALAQQGVGRFSSTTPASRGVPEQESRDDAAFQAANDNLARTMGRGQGLTDGPASTRGRAGQRTNVPPGAMYKPPRAMGDMYWQQTPGGGNNPVELAGMMNRGAQQLANGDKAGKELFLKGYNDGPWSSRTDADDIKIDKDGNVVLYAGGKPINKTPIPMQELQNITGNQLVGQTAYQRDPGAGQGQSMGFGQPVNKRQYDAAKLMGESEIKMLGDEVKALEKQLDITGDDDRPALEAKIAQAKEFQRDAINKAGRNVLASGLQGQGGAQQLQPADAMQQLIDSGKSDDEVRQIMWDQFGSEGVMRGVESQLQKRGLQPDPENTKAAGLQKDVPVGPTGQPDLKLDTAPATKKGSGFQQKYETETKANQEKQAKKKAAGDVFKKVRRLYDIMNTTKNLKPKDVEYLQSVYDDPNASAKVKKEAYSTYKKYRDLKQ